MKSVIERIIDGDGVEIILSEITNDAVEQLSIFGEKAEFLKQLALYIQNRNK